LADDHAAILDLGAELESLNRLVQVGLHHDLGLEELPRAEQHEQEDERDRRTDHEQPDLEEIGLRAHAASASASRRKNCRTHGSSLSSRSRFGSPSAMMPFLRLSSMITRSATA